MRRVVLGAAAAVVAVLVVVWALTRGLERVMERPIEDSAAETREPGIPEEPVRHITAMLYYASEDGQYLVPVKQEVPFGEGTVEQGRQIILAQLTLAPAPPLVAAIPPGATLRSFHVTGRGEAFVDLGPEIVSGHPGGSAAELLTVYALVNAVTSNLPAITRVQILVGGREVDTLAGHVDLRRPLAQNDALVRESN